MRRIQHPGPLAERRVDVVETAVRELALQLRPGRSLLSAVTEALSAAGAASAVLQLRPATLFPFAHVMPALARTPEHAVVGSPGTELEFAL